MEIYVLVTGTNASPVISGVYSSKDELIKSLTTVFSAETLHHVELWELDKGFIKYLDITKKTTITIED